MQKESLGEYGSGWEWENDWQETMHVFDQTTSDDIPIRYTNNGTSMSYCFNEVENTAGKLLSSNSTMQNQLSCKAATGNAGNWYSWSASTAGGQSSSKEPNSICPKGWQLTTHSSTDVKSFYALIRTTYNIQETDSDSRIRPLPLSFIRSGYYYLGSLSNRGSYGYYWSAVAYHSTYANYLYFGSGTLNPQGHYNKYFGYSVRCVNR